MLAVESLLQMLAVTGLVPEWLLKMLLGNYLLSVVFGGILAKIYKKITQNNPPSDNPPSDNHILFVITSTATLMFSEFNPILLEANFPINC